MNAKESRCDVLIIGASMAGSCLARQLILKHPDMSIIQVDKKTRFEHWVGESMLEIFWDYAARDLQLGHYLDTQHLYKHGLRFYFDSPNHDLPLSEMSEMGRRWYDGVPTHQIDRKRFDEDLAKMNADSGVDLRLGCQVKDIELDRDGGHRVTTPEGVIRCRWLIDAAGFSAPLARKLDLVKPIASHPISARWARFRNINPIDYMGDDAWRERANYASRYLSTNHFMYEGYWFWLIPIDTETCSIGLVWHHDMADLSIKSQDDFVGFIKSHRALRELLGDKGEPLDYHGLKNLSRVSDRFYSSDRWALTGMSAGFLDPLLSGGSAFLADSNRMIGDLIETDMSGDEHTLRNKCVAYDAHSHWWLDNFLLHINGNYHGSFDLLCQQFEPLLMDYFGIILPTSMARNWGYEPGADYGDGAALRAQKDEMFANSANHRVQAMKHELAQYLDEREGVYADNRGGYFALDVKSDYARHSRNRGRSLSPEVIGELQMDMLRVSARRALARMAKSEGLRVPEEAFEEAVLAVVKDHLPLREALDLVKEHGTGEFHDQKLEATA